MTSTATSAAPATRSSAFNWNPIEDRSRSAAAGASRSARRTSAKFSPVSNVAWKGWNFGQLYPQNTVPPQHPMYWRGAPGGLGRGQAVQSRPALDAAAAPGGISLNGGGKVPVDSGLRDYFNIEQQVLDPEKAVNWSIGFDYTPTGNFLTGLNIQATYYIVKINGILRDFGNPTNSGFNDPTIGFAYVTPEDLRDRPGQSGRCRRRPSSVRHSRRWCRRVLAHPVNEVPSSLQTLVYWINDGGVMNVGWQRTEGIDCPGELRLGVGGPRRLQCRHHRHLLPHRNRSQVPGAIEDF